MMEHMDARMQHNAFMTDPGLSQSAARTVPILAPSMLPTTSHADPMDTTSPSAMMAPPARTSPDSESNGMNGNNMGADHPHNGMMAEPNAAAAAAAAGGQQPKVVQTAFIHKLYK